MKINKCHNIPLSKHKKVNNYGNRLIQLCKNNSIFLANGRLCKDTIANFTFKDTSVIDYCIMSPEIMANTTKFEVGPFDLLFSDNHNPIHLSIVKKAALFNTNDNNNSHGNLVYNNANADDTNVNIVANSKIPRPNLSSDHKTKLCNDIDPSSLNSLNNDIDILNQNKDVKAMDINNWVFHILPQTIALELN